MAWDRSEGFNRIRVCISSQLVVVCLRALCVSGEGEEDEGNGNGNGRPMGNVPPAEVKRLKSHEAERRYGPAPLRNDEMFLHLAENIGY